MKKTMKRTIILFLFSLIGYAVFSQNTIIRFQTDTNAKLRIYRPIDGQYNSSYITEKIELNANKEYTYKLHVDGFCTLKFEFSNSGLNFVKVLLCENDTLKVINRANKITFEGKNSKGNQYLHQSSVGKYDDKISEFINRKKNEVFDFEGLMNNIQDSIIDVFQSDVQLMESQKEISPLFAKAMNKSLYNATSFSLFLQLRSLMVLKTSLYKLSELDSVRIMKKLDAIFYDEIRDDNDVFKYYYTLPFISFYSFKYHQIKLQGKIEPLNEYEKEVFGTFKYYTLAPEELRYYLLANEFLFQLKNKYSTFDIEKTNALLNEKIPGSEYLPIFSQLIKNNNQAKSETTSEGIKIIDGSKINSLRDLMKAEGLKGKYGYIDLWATYCSPCKVQFQYNDELHKVLNLYENIEKIYISVDDEKDHELWKEQISYFQLKGYHLRASASLKENIQNLVFGKELMSVPRYILVDKEGNILNNNLPLPKNTFILKKEIDKIIFGRSK